MKYGFASKGWMRYGLLGLALAGLLAGASSLDSFLPSASAMQDNPLPNTDSAISTGFNPFAQKTKLNTELPSERHSISFDPARIAYEMRPVDANEMEKTASHQVGIGRALGISSETHGRVFSTKDGSAIRILAIKSPDAVAIRVHFEHFNIPPGNEVYVYGLASDSHVAGPYTLQGPFGRSKDSPAGGEFWSDTIPGDTVIIEHYMKGGEANLYISEISHFFRSVQGNDLAPDVLACHNDAMCFSDIERDAVGRILYVNGGSSFVCTGTMMNNQTVDFAPYFLTANHCVSNSTVARTVETFWFYRTTACNSGVVSGGWVRTPAGTGLLGTLQTADSTLLRIFNAVPGGLVFSGWDTAVIGLGTSVFALSHPGGGLPPSTESYLRRASGSITSTTTACSATGLVSGLIADWTSGLVEPGSSGSALYYSVAGGNRLIGVLSCGPVTPTCADLALYGKFSNFFSTIQTYMTQGDNGGNCAATPISIGQSVNGSLAATDCRSRVRGVSVFSDRYSFSGAAGQRIAITLSSTGFDTYLYLLSPSKTLAAEDDDGGGGFNSRIPPGSGFFTLPATGTYVIEATSFSPGATGNYTLTLEGESVPCTFTINPTSQNFPATGGTGSVTVTTQAGCNWTAVSNNSFITITSGASGTGSGTVNYSVSANPNQSLRMGTITIAGQTFTVTQDACSLTINPTSQNFNSGGGSGSVTVTASTSNCSWSVTGVCSWINITSGNGGTGNGTVNYTVQANSGAARSCTMTIAGQTFTVNQSGGMSCVDVSIPTNVMAPAGSVVTVPINTTSLTGQGVTAYDFVLNFNSSILTPASTAFDTAGTLSSGMTITPNTSVSGRITISAFGTTALSGAGTLLNLRFNVSGSIGNTTDLTWMSFRYNEGTPCTNTTNGRFTVGGGSIAGTVNYCASPTPKVVPGVAITAAGTPSGNTTTDASGNYLIQNLGGGPYTVTPSKTGNVNGITSFDASLVAQHAAGLITLTTCQQTAGDASNNGSLSSFDASLIAQFAAGIPNAASIAGSWRFVPSSRNYPTLTGPMTGQNFDAILVGDVSGNWTASGSSPSRPDAQEQVAVSLSEASPVSGQTLIVPVKVGDLTGRAIQSYDFTLVYDPAVLRPQFPGTDTSDTLSKAMVITANGGSPGRLVISAFGTGKLAGAGTLLKIKFDVIGPPGSQTGLRLKSFTFNEGTPAALTAKNK